jgi:predicted deacylase
MKTYVIAFTFFWLGMSALGAEDIFPRDYESSRARFRSEAANLAAGYPNAERHEIEVGAERLTVDTLFLPATRLPRALVILTSGNHGPEGFVGSALQTLFIREVLPKLDHERTGVFLVHALNPWGFKHGRRGTENNVNLNRNFDVDRSLFDTPNPEYDRLVPLLEPDQKVCKFEFPAKDLLVEMLLKKEVTQQSLTEAIGMGQYRSPRGLNFGGQAFESQTLAITEILRRIAAPYPAILHIDLHTGLGERGVLHAMTKDTLNEVSRAAQAKLFANPADRNHYEVTPPDAEGFYDIHGDYTNLLGKLFPEDDRIILPITAEFGTVGKGLQGKIRTINRLVLENQGHFHGYADQAQELRVKRRFRELFFPSDPKWRAKTIRDGRYFLDIVVRRFLVQNP